MEISRRKVIVWGGELKKEIQFDVPDRTVFYQDRDCRRNFFSLNDDLLSRHIVLIGGSGSGKTNVFNLTLDQLRKNHQEQDIFGMMKSRLKIRICNKINTSFLKRCVFFVTGRT